MRYFSRVGLLIGLLAVGNSGSPAESAEQDDSTCWLKWTARKLQIIPKPDDTINPKTGKELSQTPGAIRTRALKYQAAKDALELRGREDPDWRAFFGECTKGN
ncbi:hypothetical protein ACVIW2_002113 [Bradyrhizobium huanghuaihaiense]|uniref:hypothetical protein n=1 Tax=Bradyrhizobium sp. B024 TaxID=3140247 RepID=UPI003184234E